MLFRTISSQDHGFASPFLGERDIQLEHLVPPRFYNDWARLHTRNLRLGCGSCNNQKNKKDLYAWLDEEEERRISNRANPTITEPEAPTPAQGRKLGLPTADDWPVITRSSRRASRQRP
jgi:hypothetical protein